MNASTLFTILVILVPLLAAIGLYFALRGRDQSVAVSGCAALALGVLCSFALTGLFFLAGWS